MQSTSERLYLSLLTGGEVPVFCLTRIHLPSLSIVDIHLPPGLGLAAYERTAGAWHPFSETCAMTVKSCPLFHLSSLLLQKTEFIWFLEEICLVCNTAIYSIRFVFWFHPSCWGFKKSFLYHKGLALTMKAWALEVVLYICRVYLRNRSVFDSSTLYCRKRSFCFFYSSYCISLEQ